MSQVYPKLLYNHQNSYLEGRPFNRTTVAFPGTLYSPDRSRGLDGGLSADPKPHGHHPSKPLVKRLKMKSLAIPSFILICAAVAKGYRLESNGLASNSASMPPGTDEEEVPRALPAGFPASTNKEHDKPIHQVVQETSFAEDAGTSVVPGTEGQDRGSARDVQQITNMQRKHKTKVPVHASEMKELASVVKIFVNTVKADFVSPWQMMAPKEHSGSVKSPFQVY